MRAQARFDLAGDLFRLRFPAMDDEPAGAFGNPQAQVKDDQAQCGADEKAEPPADFGVEAGGVEKHDRGPGAERAADPERAAERQIGPAAKARRDHLLDGGIDRAVFAADAGPCEEAEEAKARQIPRKGGGRGSHEIEAQRDEEQEAPAKPVGHPAEDQCAAHRAREVKARREPHIRIREPQDRACLQRAGDGAGERYFEPVEHPGDAKRRDDQRMKPAPGQPVEPRRRAGFDDVRGFWFFGDAVHRCPLGA